jgi:hypothetical protein
MEKDIFTTALKEWDDKRGKYRIKETYTFSNNSPLEFGGITITLGKPPYVDPTAKKSITLRKISGKETGNLFVVMDRKTMYEKPKGYTVGKTIMKKLDFFHFSELNDIKYIRIYREKPKEGKHPEYLEIVPARNVGENGSGGMLH